MNKLMEEMKEKVLLNILERFGLLQKLYPQECQRIWEKVSKLKIAWETNRYGHQVKLNHQFWYLRLNKKLDEPPYTLIIGKEAILSFNEFPTTWVV